MVRSFSIVLIAIVLLLTLPLWFGLGGGLIGLAFGLIGGLLGLIFGLFGAIIGAIAWIFKALFHLLFGWHHESGFQYGFHFNGYVFAALLILILVIASKKKN